MLTNQTIIFNSLKQSIKPSSHLLTIRRTASTNPEQPSSEPIPSTSTTTHTQDNLLKSATSHSDAHRTKTINHLSNSAYLKPIKQQFRSIKTSLSHQFADFPSKLSQLTGYGDIDKLKSLVSQTEANLRASREDAVQAKIKYNLAAQRRAESIKEVNDLLARKASWSDQDLARFTTLVRTDHSNEQAESEAKKGLEESEAKVDHQFTNMMQAILTRYHEEQVWSDKIRALSTTFSLSITLINVLVFLAAIVLVEPYKRSKVVSEVEERIVKRDMNNTDILDRALNTVVDRLSSTEKQLSDLILSLQAPLELPTSPSALPSSTLEDENQVTIVPATTTLPQVTQVENMIPSPISGSRTDPRDELMDSENKSSQQTTQEGSGIEDPAPEESQLSPQPQRSPSWYEKLNQAKDEWLENHDYTSSDQESLKAIGIGTVVGIILLSSYHFFSQ
ncbi:sensitivity to high expression protein she9 [Puccinia graminis f. sp. tritici]|uniref:Sensitive to high expression protein 9, mitochondrial n=1 Tax=Puccinia graminis f. sp. tritici TaxID=56615 RepID=A0A5B0SLM7_PUCGR|nr:sensitivity to high expression protein she9 [Puccinia graminis f. sp. tritici]